jgi:hypothetical protein
MTGKTKKIILVSVLGIAAVAAVTAYRLYNKTHFNVQTSLPAAATTPQQLLTVFISDSARAKTLFVGDENNKKIISITGEVATLKKDQAGNTVILLKTGTEGSFINCTFEEAGVTAAVGSSITVKGICTGYNFDADLGIPGDVILTRCFIVK